MTASTADQSFPSETTKPVQTLFNAVSSIKLRLVRLLIEGGIDVDAQNDRQQTPLLAACSSLQKSHFKGETRREVVKYLLSVGANVNVQDNTGRTPLIYAVITQAHASVIFDLVNAGAQLWFEDMSEKCAFDYALQQQNMSHVSVIVKAYKRCNSTSHSNPASFRKKLTGIFSPVKGTLSPKRKYSDDKKVQKVSQKHKEGHSSHSIYAALQEIQNPKTFNIPKDPLKHTISPNVPDNESHLCNLCKNVLGDELPETRNNKSEKSTNFLDLNYQEYNLSGLIYRRRSTGSLFGLTDEQCETIKRKHDLGITLEDLFSTTEINQPNFESNESLFVKSSRTNTIVDISSKSLLVPGGNRVRSASVCLPPIGNQTLDKHNLAVGRAFSFSHCDEGEVLRLPRKSPAAGRDLQRVYMTDYCGDEEEDWEDILVLPSSQIDVMSANNGMVTSYREMTSPEESTRSPSGMSDGGRSSCCTSPIPRIVFTDFVNESGTEQDE